MTEDEILSEILGDEEIFLEEEDYSLWDELKKAGLSLKLFGIAMTLARRLMGRKYLKQIKRLKEVHQEDKKTIKSLISLNDKNEIIISEMEKEIERLKGAKSQE